MRFAVVLAAAIAFAQPANDPVVTIERARERLQAMARDLEEYVCVETIDRSYFASAREQQAESTDRVRLEVTVSSERELHSWPGATRFDTRDVDEFIRNGPVSTGSFGGYLAGIFDRSGVTFIFAGERTEGGRRLLAYRYQAPLNASNFQVKIAGAWKKASHEGEVLLDARTLDLAHLEIHARDLPEGTPFSRSTMALDYEMAHIGASDVLLPKRSQLDLTLESGRATRNVTTFSGCRKYQAESEIVFVDDPANVALATRAMGRGTVSLPLGLPVTLAISNAIDTATAAAGDPIDARVMKAVRRPGTAEELLPAGAVVRGRIRRVEHHQLPQPYFLIATAFNRVEVGGAASPFFVRREASAELVRDLNANLEMRDSGIWYWGVGTFLIRSGQSHVVIPAGSESKWFTLSTLGR